MRMTLPPNVASRFDANEAVFLTRELESIDPMDYVELHSALMALKLVPQVQNVGPLDLAYTYRMWHTQGAPNVTGPGANDGARITVTRDEVTVPIKEIELEFGWKTDDIKRAASKSIGLDRMTIQMAMTAAARKIDNMVAFGQKGTSIKGLLNNTDVVDTDTPVTKTGGGTVWATTSKPSELLADLKLIVNNARAALLQAAGLDASTPEFSQWVIAVPTFHMGLLDIPRSDVSDTTVLEMAKKSQYVEDIVEWNLLGTADEGDPMIVAFPRNPMCLGAIVPRLWEQRTPQERGHEIFVPAVASCGGTVIRYPVACRYLKDV